MREERDTLPLGKNLFPGTVAFVETFDTDDDTDESVNILSFESLREAFITFRSAETELVKTMPEIGISEEETAETPERPNYEADTIIDAATDESEDQLLSSNAEVTVNVRLETIIEAALFVGNRKNLPLSADQITEKLRNVSAEEVAQTVVCLNEQYQKRNCPYTILSEHGGYRMALRSEFESVCTNFYGKTREIRLSQQAIDTLAIVAYRQPITAEEIQNIRRQPCSTILNQLVRRNLLEITRDVQDKKNVVRYHTTSRFLELCRIKSLNDIPQADEWDYR